jgi:hypothetical protein
MKSFVAVPHLKKKLTKTFSDTLFPHDTPCHNPSNLLILIMFILHLEVLVPVGMRQCDKPNGSPYLSGINLK